MEKACTKCGEIKTFDLFYKNRNSKDGLTHECIKCLKLRKRRYQQENPELIREQTKKNWYNHRDARLAYDRSRKERKRELWQQWKENSPDKYRANTKRSRGRQTWILRTNIGRRIRHALVGGIKSIKTEQYVGISVDGLKSHIEKQFESWMSWDNYSHDQWHIDHIIPCSAYDLSDEEEAKKCFNYRNMRPLASCDNFAKKDAVDLEIVNRYGISDLLPSRIIEKQTKPVMA